MRFHGFLFVVLYFSAAPLLAAAPDERAVPLRQRLLMPDGILLVLEAPAAADDASAPRGRPYLMWYRDLRDNRLHLYHHIVRTEDEIALARQELTAYLEQVESPIPDRLAERGTAERKASRPTRMLKGYGCGRA